MCIRDRLGVNTFTLGGDQGAIADAKDVLSKKGASYRNVYFASDSEAGKFSSNIYAYPTTYVVDRNGKIAVSYTHLDVYKRQSLISTIPFFRSFSQLLLKQPF